MHPTDGNDPSSASSDQRPDAVPSAGARIGLGLFILGGMVVSAFLSLVLGMSSDACSSDSRSGICSPDVQAIVFWLPWVFLGLAASAAAIGIRLRDEWFAGPRALGYAIGGYAVANVVVMSVVS